ncbi:MAG TPA: hypothetical protein VGT01_04425 [Candidatus Dormibacteraeota bacterium]|nr:hypothetical protein [Candidatus Dormibacteraeota bacterium]
MSDNEDLELQALQRQLDDAFETTRPRVGFEDELWSRMQARRPVSRRLADFFGGLVSTLREVPSVPAAAVAVVLISAIGIGLIALSGIHLGGGASSTAGSAPLRNESGGTQYNATPGAFGRLPAPSLQPVASGPTPPKSSAQDQAASGAMLYLGPATLTWAGPRPSVQITTAPVYRFREPTEADAAQFASALGASNSNHRAGTLGEFSGAGFVIGVVGSSQQPLAEPRFYITPDPSRLPPPGPTPMDTAAAFLSAHSLTPTWNYVVVTDQVADVTRVLHLRQFEVTSYGLAFLINTYGVRYGLEVDVRRGQPLQALGPLPVSLEAAVYPVIPADHAVNLALASMPSESASIQPVPAVQLTTFELVYALVNAGDHSFYEPAYLLSGTFTNNGATFVKRVLVPAVDPSQRSS